MEKILNDLYPDDYFSLLSFSVKTQIWRLIGDGKWDGATLMESDWKSLVVPVSKRNVLRGKLAIQKLRASGKKEKYFHFNVTGLTKEGKRDFEVPDTSIVLIKDQMQKGFMERLWAYLTIQQLLEEEKMLEGKLAVEKKKHATELALKHSFVTPVTSLVVVKPDDCISEVKKSAELEEENCFEISNDIVKASSQLICCAPPPPSLPYLRSRAGSPRLFCREMSGRL
ncbi:hypothetical protein C0J52_22618 [Blattella germanica]|nr:hypothetical protein C0J52_22618 [Blattella germanica]